MPVLALARACYVVGRLREKTSPGTVSGELQEAACSFPALLFPMFRSDEMQVQETNIQNDSSSASAFNRVEMSPLEVEAAAFADTRNCDVYRCQKYGPCTIGLL